MAYAASLDEEDRQAGGPQVLSPEQGTISGGESAPSSQNQPPPQNVNSGGSQFPDISRYLKANESQAKRMAAQVGSGISSAQENVRNVAESERGRLQGASQAFNAAANANQMRFNPDVANRALTNPESMFNPGQFALERGKGSNQQKGKLTQRVTPTVSDQAAYNEFQRQLNAQYGGPTALDYTPDYTAIDQANSQAKSLVDKASTDTGRLDLLRNLYGGKNVSQEASNLDNLLLRGAQAQGILGRYSSAPTNVKDVLQSEAQVANAQAQARAAQEQANAQAVKDQIKNLFFGPNSPYVKYDENTYDVNMPKQQTSKAGGNNKNKTVNAPTQVFDQGYYDRLAALEQLFGQKFMYR